MNCVVTLCLVVTLSIGMAIACVSPCFAETIMRQILLANGSAAKGIKVTIRASGDKPGATNTIQGVTDEQGFFSKNISDSFAKVGSGTLAIVDSAKYALVISSIDYWIKKDGQTPQPLHLGTADSGVKLTGKVVDLAGAPLAGARVTVLELTEGSMFGWHINSPIDNMTIPELITQSQSDGSYSLRPFVLESFSPLMIATVAADVTINKNVFSGENGTWINRKQASNIKLFPTLELSGLVLDALNNKPVPGAKISVFEVPASLCAYRRLPSVSDQQGRFSITGVPAAEEITLRSGHIDYMDGEAKLSSSDPKLSPGKLSREHPKSFHNLLIQATPLAPIAGRVIDEATGKPPVTATKGSIEDYRMRIESEFGGHAGAEPHKTEVDVKDDGSFSCKLPVGINQLALICSGYEWSAGTWKSEMKVTRPGQNDLVLKVREKIGTMVRFETQHPENMKQYWLERLYDKSWTREWIVSTPQFFGWNGSKWGDKATIRVVRKDTGAIVVPQQDIVADPKHWLVSIPVP